MEHKMRQKCMPCLLLIVKQITLGVKFETKYSQHLIQCINKITETEFTNNNALANILLHEQQTETQNDKNLLRAEPLQLADAALMKPFLGNKDILVRSTVASHISRHNFNKATYCNKYNNYILFLQLESEKTEKTMKWLRKHMNSIKNKYKWNAKSHFVIAILEKRFGQREKNITKRSLQEMYSCSIVNTVVLMSEYEKKTKYNKDFEAEKYEMKIGAYKWFPFKIQNPATLQKT
jgi:hypothetical protein